jgi:hypothetical protein
MTGTGHPVGKSEQAIPALIPISANLSLFWQHIKPFFFAHITAARLKMTDTPCICLEKE